MGGPSETPVYGTQGVQAENGRLWALVASKMQGAASAGQAGSAAEVCEQYSAMCQRMEKVLRERADVAARLSAAQVPCCAHTCPLAGFLLPLPYCHALQTLSQNY